MQVLDYFQRLIKEVLNGLHFTFGYLDDILIVNLKPETHMKHLEILFQPLQKGGLKLKEIKCNILKKHLQYLGHLTSEPVIEPLPERLSSIQDISHPRNPKEVKQFLGLADYYRKLVI